MESAALLTPTDISIIRRYVHTKYAPLPGDRRAEIVADAIRRTLQQRLPNLPAQLKNRMTDELITRCLVGEQRDIIPDDVLDLCAELEFNESDRNEQLLAPILDWVNEHTPGRWNTEQLNSRLDRRKIYTLALVPDLSAIVDPDTKELRLGSILLRSQMLLRRVFIPSPVWLLLAAVIISAVGASLLMGKSAAPNAEKTVNPPSVIMNSVPKPDVGMPERLKYAEFDIKALKKYLISRDSLLVEEPYFGAIVDNARQYNIHPLLLFAITGQEQGFVPKSSKDAAAIANNPFNVFHSWEDYNTDIHHSAEIAAKLIAKLAKSRPEGHDPFTWFNKTYAEDPLWSDGVSRIFEKLVSLPPTT
jgi:hypothetical protein